MFWKDLLIPLLVMWPMFIGLGLLLVNHFKQENLSPMLTFSLSAVLGVGVSTVLFFLLGLFGIALDYSVWILLGISLGSWFKVIRNKQFIFTVPNTKTIILWLIILPLLLLVFLRNFSTTFYTWDAVAFWGPKNFALWQDQRVLPNTFDNFNHPEYPIMLPYIGASTYTLFSYPSEIAFKAAVFIIPFALLIVMQQLFAHKKIPWHIQLISMLLLISSFIFREHLGGEYSGTADILVGSFIAVGACMLLLGEKWLAIAVWMFVPWTKSEGLVWAASAISLTVIFEVMKGYSLFTKEFYIKLWKDYAVKLSPLALTALGWFLYTKFQSQSSQYFKYDEIYERNTVEYLTYSLHSLREEFRNLEKWNLIFFLFIAAIGTNIKRLWHEKTSLIIIAAIVTQLVVYTYIFTITPEEQASFIAAAISRLTLHIAPATLIVSTYLLSKSMGYTRLDDN